MLSACETCLIHCLPGEKTFDHYHGVRVSQLCVWKIFIGRGGQEAGGKGRGRHDYSLFHLSLRHSLEPGQADIGDGEWCSVVG